MTILQLKAALYRYTGIDITHKEHYEYLTSNEYWTQFKDYVKHDDEETSLENIQSLLIGMWECDNRIYRPVSSWGRGAPWPIKAVAFVWDNFKSVWWDIRCLLKL